MMNIFFFTFLAGNSEPDDWQLDVHYQKEMVNFIILVVKQKFCKQIELRCANQKTTCFDKNVEKFKRILFCLTNFAKIRLI